MVLVGYNNQQSYWIVRSSWGPNKGVDGYYKVAYGAVGIAEPSSNYGLRFVPFKPVPTHSPDQVSPATKKGCYNYKASGDDHYGKVAQRFGVSVKRLLLENQKKGQDVSASLAGRTILVCSADAAVASALPPTTQAEALLKIKQAVDPNNVLRTWVMRPDSQPYAWCSWTGITCDDDNSVTKIVLTDTTVGKTDLAGVLPDADALLTLPKLQTLSITDQNLAGTLPDDYGKLTGLKQLYLSGNKLRGALPAAWAGMSSLDSLILGRYDDQGDKTIGNLLEGTLPSEWGSMAKLVFLSLVGNNLRGALPDSWGSLQLGSLQLGNNQLTGGSEHCPVVGNNVCWFWWWRLPVACKVLSHD